MAAWAEACIFLDILRCLQPREPHSWSVMMNTMNEKCSWFILIVTWAVISQIQSRDFAAQGMGLEGLGMWYSFVHNCLITGLLVFYNVSLSLFLSSLALKPACVFVWLSGRAFMLWIIFIWPTVDHQLCTAYTVGPAHTPTHFADAEEKNA